MGVEEKKKAVPAPEMVLNPVMTAHVEQAIDHLDEEQEIHAEVSPSPPDPTAWFDLKMKIFTAAVVLLSVVAIVVGVVSSKSKSPSPSTTTVHHVPKASRPSDPPSPSPSAAPTSSALPPVLDYLKALGVTEEGVFENFQSAQYRAALWLVEQDFFDVGTSTGMSIEDPKILQRYALAAFYFATGGDNWKLCGKNSPSCGDTPWLTATDECEWFSLSCDGDGIVSQMRLPENGNNLIGFLPAELSLLTGLRQFIVPGKSRRYQHSQDSLLHADLDVAFAGLTSLEKFSMPYHRLEATLPIGILLQNRDLVDFDLGNNQIRGKLPGKIGVLTNLHHLNLGQNTLSGTIPTELGNLTELVNLDIQENELVGSIPDALHDLTKLEELSLGGNDELSGSIPPLISKLTDLRVLRLGFTKMGGTLPNELFELYKLSELYLEGGGFSGTLPKAFRLLNASLNDLFLNYNQFSGPVPKAFDYLTGLETLRIEGNQLTGSISAAVCAERGLNPRQLATLIVDCVVTCTCCDNCID